MTVYSKIIHLLVPHRNKWHYIIKCQAQSPVHTNCEIVAGVAEADSTAGCPNSTGSKNSPFIFSLKTALL